MKKSWKKALPHIIAIAIFYIITCIYFAPGIFGGKSLNAGDTVSWQAQAQELKKYWDEEEGSSFWTGSMFSGMPSYSISYYDNTAHNFLVYFSSPFKLLGEDAGGPMLIALICFYILMCVMGVNTWLAIAGAIAFGFATYNPIIIQAGHITKIFTIAYMPLTLAGIWLLFKEKFIWGFVASTIGVATSLVSLHIQITYYLVILCVFFFIGLSVNYFLQKKKIFNYLKIVGILAIAVCLSTLSHAEHLYLNYETAQTSLRGPSELTPSTEQEAEAKQSSGLDIDYAYSWSYGRGELLTLLIPRAYGGASGEIVSKGDEFYDTYTRLSGQRQKEVQAPTYWGEQPFTSGPVYFGAVICFLFVLGMFVVKSKTKWWIFGATILCILMSLGKHCMILNEFLFYHLPMFSKFRTPSMILVIPSLTFIWLGFWGLRDILRGDIDKKKVKKSLFWALGITGGICLLIGIMPSVFLSFKGAADAQYSNFPAQLMDALIASRKSMAISDAFRSLFFILAAGGLLFYYVKKMKTEKLQIKNNRPALILSIGLLLLITVDLLPIDRNYLGSKHYHSKKESADVFKKTPADEYILQDTTASYRVLNLARNTFNESMTSYYHKNIGGYSAAKLRRYQELIDHRISKEINYLTTVFNSGNFQNAFENTPTLNMLNLKYFIYNNDAAPIINNNRFGNAWFIDSIYPVENADAEIAALDVIDPKKVAVYDKKFEDIVQKYKGKPYSSNEETNSIELLEYKPNKLVYHSKTSEPKVAVFSEIYYPEGWNVTIDGEKTEHFRVDWTLRAMNVPAGEHNIVFEFYPHTAMSLIRLSQISSLLVILLLVAAVCYKAWKSSRQVV
ncbi:MAG: YfhO family protein [Bacteroidales bacterium]|jgi:uncharacterized protein (DUF1330 family)|nr:YfhO family protein [Bacteroidales bacterium]